MKIFGKSIPKPSRNTKNLMAIIAIAVVAGLLLWLGIWWLFFGDRFPRAEVMTDIITFDGVFERRTFGRSITFRASFSTRHYPDLRGGVSPNRAVVILNGWIVHRNPELYWDIPFPEGDYWISNGSFLADLNLSNGINEVTILALSDGYVIDERTIYILSDHRTPQSQRTMPILLRISIDYDPEMPWIVDVTAIIEKGNADEVLLSGHYSLVPGGGGRRYIEFTRKDRQTFSFAYDYHFTVEFHEDFDPDEFYWSDAEYQSIRIFLRYENRWGAMSGGAVITFIDGSPRITTVSQSNTSTNSVVNNINLGWGIALDRLSATPPDPRERTAPLN
jgi:hypothetical protein